MNEDMHGTYCRYDDDVNRSGVWYLSHSQSGLIDVTNKACRVCCFLIIHLKVLFIFFICMNIDHFKLISQSLMRLLTLTLSYLNFSKNFKELGKQSKIILS